MNYEPDIKIVAGLKGGGSLSGSSGKLIQDQLNTIASQISAKGGLKIKVDVDTNKIAESTSKIRNELNKATNASGGSYFTSLKTKDIVGEFTRANPVLKQMAQHYREAEREASALSVAANKITSVKTSDVVAEFTKANPVLKQMAQYYREIEKESKAYQIAEDKISAAQHRANAERDRAIASLNLLQSQFPKMAGTQFQTQFDAISQGLKDNTMSAEEANAQQILLRKNMTAAGLAGQTFGQKVKAAFEKFAQYVSVSTIILSAIRSVKQMVSEVKELDSAMTQLQIVSGKSASEIRKFGDEAIQVAKKIGVSATDILKASETYARLGYSLKDAMNLSEYTNIFANIASTDVSSATDAITSIMKAYQLDAGDAEHITDILTKVGQEYAVSASELGVALQNGGASLQAANNSLEKSVALIAAGNAAVQDASKVGNALKTTSMRIRGATTAELEDAGADIDGMAESVSKLRDKLLALSGVDIQIDENTFKDTYTILLELSKVWDGMKDINQANVLELLAGKKNATVVQSIITNIDDLEGAYASASNAMGTTAEANDIYVNSIEGKQKQLKTSFTEFSDSVVNSDLIKGTFDAGSGILGFLTKLNEAIGVLPTTLGIAGIGMLLKNLGSIKKELQGVAETAKLISGKGTDGVVNTMFGTSGQQQAALLAQLGLRKEQVAADLAAVASGEKVILTRIQEAAATKNLTPEILQEIAASDALVLAKKEDAVITISEILQGKGIVKLTADKTAAEIVNTAAVKGNTTAVGANAAAWKAWFLSNPVLWILAVVAAIGILTTAVVNYYKKQEEIFQEQKSSLDEQKAKLDELITKHEEAKKSLDSLYSLRESQGLTDAEKEQLVYQEETLENLEREIKYREELARIAAKEVSDKAVARLNSGTVFVESDEPRIGGSGAFGGGSDNTYATSYAKAVNEYVERIEGAETAVKSLNDQYDKGLISAEDYARKLSVIEQDRENAVNSGKDVVSAIEKELPYVTDKGQLDYWQGIVDSFEDAVVSVSEATSNTIGKASDEAVQNVNHLGNAIKSLKTDTTDLETAITAISSGSDAFNDLFSILNDDGESEYLDNLLSTFPQLRNEILAYNDAIAAGGDKVAAATKLQQEMNDALNQFRADKLVQEIENISSAAESYGKDSHAVIEAIEELDGIIPGLSNTLIDENGVLRDNAVAALTSAEGLLACVEANKSLGLAAAQLDLSNAKKQLDDLGASASMAAIRLAESAVITAQLNLDSVKQTIEDILGKVGTPKSSSGKKEKDPLVESYEAEVKRLDHLREMDKMNEATYYNEKLAALQKYLKDREKYQEQWWAWEEEFHKYQKQLIEDEIDRLEDARDDQIDANEEYYKARKKQEEDAYEAEKDRVDKVIDELDRELDAKKKSIQKQRDLLDEQADDREYNKSIEQKNKEIADIKAQLTVLDLDDSAEAKAKKIALQEELTDKLNDLEDYQYDHSVDTQKNALDKQETYWEDHFGKLIEAQELYLENLKTMYDQTIESIESSMEAMTNSIKASFDSLIAAQQSLLNNAGSIPGMAEITPIGGGSGDDKPGSNEYKVKKGDNLSRIAKAKGTSVSKLLELNPWIKDKNKIYPGQIIKYHDGGVVGKSINDKDKEVLSQLVPVSRDEVLAKLLRGEVVVNEKQQGLMRDAWMSIVPSMALATKQADMAKALASNVTTNNSPNIVFDMKIELGNTDAAGLTALQRQLENFKNEAVKAVYERMSNHRQKTGRINPYGRY